MAHVTVHYTVQSCPVCHKQLLKVTTGSTIIGSPLITCKKCGRTYRTDLREEWYQYDHKWQLWAMPFIITAIGFVVGMLIEGMAIAIMASAFMFIFGLCWSLKDLIRMFKSKKRMRNPEYLAQLLVYGVLTPGEYEEFMKNAA